jgi:hypothetical protein
MARKANVKSGDEVTWKWGQGTGKGEVTKVHKSDTTIKSKGQTVKRKASSSEPAVEIKTNKGAKVLKSASEIKVK